MPSAVAAVKRSLRAHFALPRRIDDRAARRLGYTDSEQMWQLLEFLYAQQHGTLPRFLNGWLSDFERWLGYWYGVNGIERLDADTYEEVLAFADAGIDPFCMRNIVAQANRNMDEDVAHYEISVAVRSAYNARRERDA